MTNENNKFDTDDQFIRRAVQSMESEAPEIPKLSENPLVLNTKTTQKLGYMIKAIAASIILVFGLLFIPGSQHTPPVETASNGTEEEISEIRTDFYLKEDNIKIIWIQKKEFKLNQRRTKS